MLGTEPIQAAAVPASVSEEDAGRANLYALLSRLFLDAPAPELLSAVVDSAPDAAGGGAFPRAWAVLAEAARRNDCAAIRADFDRLFVSVGLAAVNPYAGHYLQSSPTRNTLADLRREMARHGLARFASTGEPEDHVSALCETMRHLIVGSVDGSPVALDEQRRFFQEFIAPWHVEFCDSLAATSGGGFYAALAGFARAFLDLESESFDID